MKIRTWGRALRSAWDVSDLRLRFARPVNRATPDDYRKIGSVMASLSHSEYVYEPTRGRHAKPGSSRYRTVYFK